MKRSIFLMLIVALAAALVAPGPVQAQSNSGAVTWTSSIYYFNTDDAAGELAVDYYTNDGTWAGTTAPDENHKINVPAHGSGEVYIGEVNVNSGFKGSAILSSSVKIVAIYEQSPNSGPNFSRLLYSAFDAAQGSDTIYVPAFSRNTKGYMTQLGVQNVSDVAAKITVDVYDKNGAAVGHAEQTGVGSQTSFILSADPKAQQVVYKPTTQTDFSAIVKITKSNPADPGNDPLAVAAVEELQMNGRRAYAFEAVPTATTGPILMPSFLCKSGHGAQTTYYAIQNVGDTDTSVVIKAYKDTGDPLGVDYPIAKIPAHGKFAFNACSLTKTKAGSGWAVIQSKGYGTNGQPQPLAVMGKVQGGDGLATAFTGMTDGSDQVFLPYVLWTATPVKSYRSTIGITNAGGAGKAQVTFYRNDEKSFTFSVDLKKNGKLTFDPSTVQKSLPADQKVLRSDGSFHGAVEIHVTEAADTNNPPKLISVVRMERKVSGVTGYTYFGEDYTGVPAR